MKINSVEFVKSAFERSHWVTDRLPEIAFLGRSNVGKSSLINSLLNRKALARISNTPGRTQSINFFRINDLFYFVDLPGYGFAKVSKTMRHDWGKMAEEYLSERLHLVLSVQLVDARHDPTPLDMDLNQWLIFHEKPHVVVATKADKLSNNQLFTNLRKLRSEFSGSSVLPYSSQTGKGREDVWKQIEAAVENKRLLG